MCPQQQKISTYTCIVICTIYTIIIWSYWLHLYLSGWFLYPTCCKSFCINHYHYYHHYNNPVFCLSPGVWEYCVENNDLFPLRRNRFVFVFFFLPTAAPHLIHVIWILRIIVMPGLFDHLTNWALALSIMLWLSF